VRDYINRLEAHLAEAHRQAARLIKKETELNGALEEFGHAAEQLVGRVCACVHVCVCCMHVRVF